MGAQYFSPITNANSCSLVRPSCMPAKLQRSIMNTNNRLTKELVREYLVRRISSQAPLPDRDQIKRQLGVALIAAQRARK